MIVRRALVGWWVVAAGVVSEPVANYERCETPRSPDARALDRWRAAFGVHPAARACRSPFCGIPPDTSGGGLYLRDRCWAPRAVCALTDGNGTLFVGQRDADGRALEAGRYLAVLGPAAALGAASHVGFADVLRRSLGVPVVNFGRGGVGPADFGGAPALLHRVAANAAAVVVVLMAGRSSANSLSPAGVPALERDAAVAAASPRLAARLRNESLATAAEEYARLAASLRTNAGREPPDVVLVWLSECSLKRGGCAHPRAFPQFYTIEAGAPARVAEIAKTLGATRLVDASYDLERLGSPIALALDECANPACPPPSARDARVCAMDAVRREIGSSASACTKRCAFVLPSYYPPDAAHAAVARALAPWARAALARRGAVVAAPALPPPPPRLLSPEEGAGGRGLDLRGHIFFAHVHKCSGLAFANFLRRAVSEAGGSWCERLVAADLARPAVALGSVAAWWRGSDSDASPECTLLTLETPTTRALRAAAGRSPKSVTLRRRAPSSNTINVLHTTEEHCALARFLATGGAPEASAWCERHGCARECAATTGARRVRARRRQLGVWMPPAAVVAAAEARWEARARRNATPAREPQVLVMVRDPVARCRSHWLFDQRMCRARRHVAHSREYCAAFLRRFGAVGSAESHRAFAREHCRDQLAPALDGAGAALRFVGIAERYAASLCLLLYDAGRFPRELCTCNGTAKLLAEAARPVDEQIASSFKFKASLAASHVGHVPRLRLRRAELEALGATDVARYRAARAHFEARVREAEARVGQKFANCPRARPAPLRPPKRPSRVRALGAGIGALSLLLLALRRSVWRGGPRVR